MRKINSFYHQTVKSHSQQSRVKSKNSRIYLQKNQVKMRSRKWRYQSIWKSLTEWFLCCILSVQSPIIAVPTWRKTKSINLKLPAFTFSNMSTISSDSSKKYFKDSFLKKSLLTNTISKESNKIKPWKRPIPS